LSLDYGNCFPCLAEAFELDLKKKPSVNYGSYFLSNWRPIQNGITYAISSRGFPTVVSKF
jgi:hypothetical protein